LHIKIACFTGHRYQSFRFGDNEKHRECVRLKKALRKEIINLVKKRSIKHFISGMALGVDIWCAEIILRLKKRYRDITLECALPCAAQSRYWSEEQRQRYYDILAYADRVSKISERYHRGCMMERNRYMVDKSEIVLAVWNGKPHGGTYNTLRYAVKKRKRIIILNPLGRREKTPPNA